MLLLTSDNKHSDHHIDTRIQKTFKYPTVGILRNLKYLKAVTYTTVAIMVFVLFMTFQPNQYSHGQTTSGNMSTLAETIEDANSNESADNILHRGIAVSEEFKHPYLNDTHRVIILPFREDQRSYTGILNFRASTPVDVILGQRVPIDSKNLSIVEKEFGDLEAGNITHGTVKALAAGVVLKPQYGDSPQYYSASIPFIADSIVLRAEQPFVTVYLVSAQLESPEPVIKLK